jgi:hypothetical protein
MNSIRDLINDAIGSIVQEQNNLTIHEVTIIGKDGEKYKIFPAAGKFSYVSMALSESLFEASVIGRLIIRDINSTAEQINFSGFEDIVIKLESPSIPNSYKSLKFKVYNVKALGDQIHSDIPDPKTNITDVKLEVQFTSYEHYLLNYKEFKPLAGLTGSDIITPIATKSKIKSTIPTVINVAQEIVDTLTPKEIGLVNLIEDKYFKTGKDSSTTHQRMRIEETDNWVWYKQNQLMYPWAKLNKPTKVAQLLQYLAENAVSKSNKYACNFLFWQDLDKWNFISIEALLKEPVARVYISSLIPTKTRNIYDLQIVQESNFLRLFEANAFSGKYYLVEPKWNEPYREYLDYNDSHTIKEITYDYHRDYNKWKKLEQYPMISKDVKTEPTVSNIITDNISGYFEPSYANKQRQVNWEHYGYTFGNRDSSTTWQPMFDQIELDGKTCKIIQKEIKEVIKSKKEEYARKKNLKEKWKVYRCSICCDDTYFEDTGLTAGAVFSQEYGIAAAGGFTDVVNFKKGATGSTAQFPLGLTFSYDLHSGSYSQSIGDILHLTEHPELKTKYLYDLELKRIDIAQLLLKKYETRYQTFIDYWSSLPKCPAACPDGYGDPCDTNEVFSFCGGWQNIEDRQDCWCNEEGKNKYINDYTKKLENIKLLANSEYFIKIRETVQLEKEKFIETYAKYKDRKAFFISKELGFTADHTKQTPLNVKSVTRIPIRGSKYEKLAHKTVLPDLLKGITGTTFQFKGFTKGTTYYYPYDIFYDNDSEINPKEKHPHYDSGYNMDVGYNAIPTYSIFEQSGGPSANSSGDGILQIFGISFKYKTTLTVSRKYFVQGNCSGTDQGNGGFGGGGNGNGGGSTPGGGFGGQGGNGGNGGNNTPPCDPCATGSYKTDSNTSTGVKDTYSSSADPNSLIVNNLLLKIVDETAKDIENTLNNQAWETIEITKTANSIVAYAEGKSYNCPNKTETIKYEYSFSIEKIYTDNGDNPNNLPSGVIYQSIIGAERLPDFNLLEFLNSRNLIDIETIVDDKSKKPTETILEELESYVRIEFVHPIGISTKLDFPSGFYDKPGSEYYLPYHVLLTSGPFGSKSTDYNISVLGQDPFGFDVAVKRIKKKSHEVQPDKKALVNFKDYHILSPLHNRAVSSYASFNYYDDYGGLYDLNAENGTFTNNQLFYGDVPVPVTPRTSYSSYRAPVRYSLYWPNVFNVTQQVDEGLKDQTAINRNFNFTKFNSGGPSNIINTSELFYYDMLYRVTRKNPLALPKSYFEFSNIRNVGVRHSDDSYYSGRNYLSSFADEPTNDLNQPDIGVDNIILVPGNVFCWRNYESGDVFPVDTSNFKSSAGYSTEEFTISQNAFFELDIRDRNIREGNEPPNETSLYGFYTGCAIWKHPAVDGMDLSDEEIQKAIWKNDITGESEYGIVGLELNEQDSTFDRNFAAQFVVVGPLSLDGRGGCEGYPCSNPDPISNAGCPPDDPVCNCPCQELRPDRMTLGITGGYSGITGPEPTYKELSDLEKEIRECDLIEEKLGEEWLGCMWGDPKSPLNCTCPCIGEKFMDYLRYSQTYCTFWNTPPERPLLRNAQMVLINANKVVIKVNGDLTMRPGMVVSLSYGNKRFSGKWLVASINHDFGMNKHFMSMTLIRDSEYTDHENRSKKLILNTWDQLT